MKIEAKTPEEYLSKLPEDRKPAIEKLASVIRKHLPGGFEEGIQYNMIGFYVPHSTYPDGYHVDPSIPLPFISLASQKNYVALYHSGIYADSELHDWFVQEYPKHAKYKLDMGKSCIRFKRIDDIPYELIGELCEKVTPEEWIARYEKNIKR